MDSEETKRPIGIFDSGMGGLTVLRECVKIMGNEDYIFYGDSFNAPYGVKSTEQVYRLSKKIVQLFLKKNVKAIVIACNTATSASASRLRKEYPELPIIGLEPALKPAVLHKKNSTVLVMATPLTLREEKFNLLAARFAEDEQIIPLPCPGLVELIEDGHIDSPELDEYLENLLSPYKDQKIDALVLGCTHYPHIKKAIMRHLSPGIRVYDGGEGTARETRRRLDVINLLNHEQKKGRVEIINSSDDKRLIKLSEMLLYR